ncbi:MAG: [Fe-Fe] hydrogenase large subunit C-terminal domain-containing protein [Desulfosporosinus sp.]|nr:[Fe-Fe] hydrogenase large subunit C-terminal domain-containing protein [Desulfosporosinus sp.]
MGLPEVIRVDKTKCQHCLACILVCPVKLCNIVEPDGITVKADLCIGCGECIKACREKGHYARSGIDDFSEFLSDIESGVPVGVLVAPAAAVNYAELMPNVLTALREIGVYNVFDVSFGAEITTYLYLQALKNGAQQPIIAQPCPAVVSFIEIYHTELIPFLAPTQSPALDVAIWLKNQPEFSHLKLAFLGPCLAKRREFHDPNTRGVVAYNITFESLDNYLSEQGINLAELEPSGFDTPEAERGIGYSQPGGLTETFNRFGVPMKKSDIQRIEGPQEVYTNYLPELKEDILRSEAPVLIDVLNCLHGCSVGPAITHKRTPYQIDKIIEKRKEDQMLKHNSANHENAKNLFKDFYAWIDAQDIDFSRVYSDKSSNKHLSDPKGEEEEQIWELMHKLTPEERTINCSSCGYGNCHGMMLAILNGLNHRESCKYYLFKENERNLRNVEAQTIEIEEANAELELLNDGLEQTVALRTQSIRNLLDNAGQGFLSFGSDLLIHNEYSSECTKIFARDIHGLRFSQLIFSEDVGQENFLASLLVKVLNNNDPLFREIYLPLLPTEVTIDSRVISIEYKLIEAENGSESYYMVILTDITDRRTLETKIEQERNLLKMVVNVVLNYVDFNQTTKEYINFCERRLQEILDNRNKATLADKVTEIFRHVHTFKGSFAQLGLSSVVANLHDLETEIELLKKNLVAYDLTLTDVEDFFAEFSLQTWLDDDISGLQDILGQDFFSKDDELVIDGSKLIEIEKKIETILTPVECKILIPELRKLRYKSFDWLLKSYPEYVANLAERLEKSVYVLIKQDDPILVNPDRFYDFSKSLIHIFRNAVDHGLESVYERLEEGKEEFGIITCTISETEKQVCLSITDDGRGIDAENLRNKAVASRLRTKEEVNLMTDEEAIQLIFEDGLSTKDDVNDLSGRGVGLAAVLSELNKLGGSVVVKTELGVGSGFNFCLPKETEGVWEVTIPELMQPLIDTTSKFMLEQTGLLVTHEDNFQVEGLKKIELNKITAIINIKGALEIVVIVSFSELVLRKLVRNFIMDEITLDEEEAYMGDVLGEVVNIIIGNSLKEFPGLEELLIIDPPISLSSEDALFRYKESQIWGCSLQTELGNISLNLVLPRGTKIIDK